MKELDAADGQHGRLVEQNKRTSMIKIFVFVFALEHLDRWLKEKKGASLIKSCLQTLSGHPWTPSASTSWAPVWGSNW